MPNMTAAHPRIATKAGRNAAEAAAVLPPPTEHLENKLPPRSIVRPTAVQLKNAAIRHVIRSDIGSRADIEIEVENDASFPEPQLILAS